MKRSTMRALGAGLLVAWFAWFLRPALFNGFNDDDPMNMHGYFRVGWPVLLRKMVLFFEPAYRPTGGALFKLSYDLFGYQPLPLHVMIAAVLLGNVFLARRFAELVSGSAAIGFVCAFAVTYHARMPNLYYAPAFLYDVLCFAFFFSALNLYLVARCRGEGIRPGRLAAVLALYAGALGSKEMAITFPAVLLLYEGVFHAPAGTGWREFGRWVRGPALPAWIAGVMTALAIVGKSVGPDAVVLAEGYRMSPTLGHAMAEQAKYVNEIFYAPFERPWFTGAGVVALWIAVIAAGIRLGRRHVVWAGLCAIVTPLPIAVLTGRGGSSLYVALPYWALIVGTVCVGIHGVLVRRAGPIVAGLLAAVVLAAFGGMVVHENRFATAQMAEPTLLAKHIASEVRRVLPRVPRGSKALYLNDLTDAWDTYFITELVWRDPTSRVWLQHKSHLAQGDIDGMDYLLEFAPDRTLRVVRMPGSR